MPRTKQNNPKNLKDKIEEAQKELKDPKISQKALSESSRRHAEVKGLKRKKVVGENQLKKVPKSPVKKPPQAKPSEAGAFSSSSGRAAACCSFSGGPSQNVPPSLDKNGDADTVLQVVPQAPGKQRVKTDVTSNPGASEGLMQTEASLGQPRPLVLCDGGKGLDSALLKEEWTNQAGTLSPSHASAPLEVLLKAMEPDLTSLTQEKGSFSVTCTGKVDSALATQPTRQESATVPAVNYGIPSQPMLPQYNPVPQPVLAGGEPSGQDAHLQYQPLEVPVQSGQSNLQHGAVGFAPSAAHHRREKHGLQQMYGAVPTASLTHTPVPSGHKALPQSQPVVYTCQSVSASVPSTIQVPVTPGYNQVQMATIVNPSLEPVSSMSGKDQKPKKQGKYVCEYCNRACAKPSVLLKHKRSHTGERPYPCLTCDFSFKTKSNLYKHKKSHAHAIKLGKVVQSDAGIRTVSQESDKGLGVHSDVEESTESDKESVVDLDPDSSQSSFRALSDSSLQSICTTQDSQGEVELPAVLENLKSTTNQKTSEPKAALPKVVVHPVNVSPLRADSPRAVDSTPELATAQKQREFQTVNVRPNVKVLSSLREVECTSPPQEAVSEDEDHHSKSPPAGGHAQLMRQQATDFSQQQQGKCLLSPRSLGSTDSGYFSRSESADQAMSPPSPFVKITPPTEMDVSKNVLSSSTTVVAAVMHATSSEKPPALHKQIRPLLETKALSLEEHISKLISDNEAVVDDKQLDSVKPRRTSLSRRGSIDSPKSYIFKDSFQFDLKPMGRRSSSSSDIPKSPFTPTDQAKQVFLLSVPSQYPSMDCLPITRSNSMPTTPGYSALPIKTAPQPHPLRVCQSFDDKIGSSNDDVFISAPATPNPAIHPRTLVRQIAIEDSSTNDGHSLSYARSMDEGYRGPNIYAEVMQRSKSFEQGPAPERNKKPYQNKGTMYECETCRNRYRKLENFENHKKFYCSELHGPKNKSVSVRDMEADQGQRGVQQAQVSHQRAVVVSGITDQVSAVRKRRKMKSVGDDDDQSPTDTNPPCSGSFDSCQMSKDIRAGVFPQHSVLLDMQPTSNLSQVPHLQLISRSTEATESRLSPIREAQMNICTKERGDLQRQGSGTSVIRHTNSLSRPNSFETAESIDRSSPVDLERESQCGTKPMAGGLSNTSLEGHTETVPLQKSVSVERPVQEQLVDRLSSVQPESCAPVQQSRLVRQNNIQVPEILVTEEPDREQENQGQEPEKHLETFNWPQRSESLSKLPTEKLPPKKKRIRLAQMEHSSGESSFESSLSRSLSRDSSLSRGSSVSASFDRDDLPRSESPVRNECASKPAEFQALPSVNNTLGVPDSKVMRRTASEQISCTQPSGEITTEYRSKSFDCGTISPTRSLSPMEKTLPKSPQAASGVQVPLIERRRGPLVRQMSLKIGPDSQQPTAKQTAPLNRTPSSNVIPVPSHRTATRPIIAQPLIPHQVSPVEPLQQINGTTVQSVNLGSHTQHPPVHGLPHPWHQTSRVVCQSVQQPSDHDESSTGDIHNSSTNIQDKKHFVPKYQLQYPSIKTSQTYSLPGTQVMQIGLPVGRLPVPTEIVCVSKPGDGIQNVCMIPPNHQVVPHPVASIVLPICLQGNLSSYNKTGVSPLPQILVTHDQLNPSTIASSHSHPPHSKDSDASSSLHTQTERSAASANPQLNSSSISDKQNIVSDVPLGALSSLHHPQKVALCPQQEPSASSKRMLSPANSLDIAMEKHQKRVKDEHGSICLTDGKSFGYLNSKMADMTRQRKFVLVRQACTTESVDSPIGSEPVQDQEKPEADKVLSVGPQTPSTTNVPENLRSVQETETTTEVDCQVSNAAAHASPGQTRFILPANSTLKSQGKNDDRKSPGKSPVRTLGFHGQVKLGSSVSVVNTRDSHRLSFPSLKTTTAFTWCYLMKRRPLHIPQTDQRISAYSNWAISKNNPNPLGLPTKVVMSLFDSKQTAKKMHYTQAINTSLKSDILTYSGKLKDCMPKVLAPDTTKSKESASKVKSDVQQNSESDKESSSSKTEPRRVKIFDGGYKSNEEYVYVRGRGRGKYICEECGIRCKKPSMLRKHIRTHSDVRPYHCSDCNFSFKTKGNLTKHMKSKAHSKKCLEMGVLASPAEDVDTEDSGDRSRMALTDRPGSDCEESDGPEDDDNEAEEEDEEDSQAESSLSATPSVSASPQHFPSAPPTIPPSTLLAQMSLSGSPPIPSGLPGEGHASDTESVTMMSPVSPCRQMSIDYPDSEVPVSPPSDRPPKPSQDVLNSPPSQATEAGLPVDRGTQTSLPPCSAYAHAGPLHFLPQSQISDGTSGGSAHLFSHLPLHSQQPSRTPYNMVPVGGIQLVPAGLAAYSTFVPVQAGRVQLTIPAVSVIHHSAGGPLSAPGSEGLPQADAAPEPPSVLPCLPLGPVGVAGLQTIGPPQALQPVGLEALGLMGLANTGGSPAQLLPQSGLAINAVGLQVLAASPIPQGSPAPQGSPTPQAHLPSLQILNFTLPAIIPSLSPVPLAPDAAGAVEGLNAITGQREAEPLLPGNTAAADCPTSSATHVQEEATSASSVSTRVGGGDGAGEALRQDGDTHEPVSCQPANAVEKEAKSASVGGAKARPLRQQMTVDYNDASSDDEDRLVIAT